MLFSCRIVRLFAFGLVSVVLALYLAAVGMSDQQIVQSFISEYGPGIYLAPPNALGWIVPYALAGAGLLVIVAFMKKYRKPKPLTDLGTVEPDVPELRKYKDQIEKDMANLE